jgi:kinetochore protein Mis12/MTW1
LQSLLSSVRPSLASLAAPDTSDATLDERRQYIETQAKRHLQATQGLELGAQGEVRDGEWQGKGKRPGEGQVRDLERVVEMVGGGGAVEEEGERMDEGD